MNYNDYYTRQAGGALPYFVGARVQRGHGLSSLFGGLIRHATHQARSRGFGEGGR